MEKVDCVGHVQKVWEQYYITSKINIKAKKKRAIQWQNYLRKVQANQGPNILLNYYEDTVRRNKGDIKGMMQGVHAFLLHLNSVHENSWHHLCPKRPDLV